MLNPEAQASSMTSWSPMSDTAISRLLVGEAVLALLIVLLFILAKPRKPSNPQHPLPSHEPPLTSRCLSWCRSTLAHRWRKGRRGYRAKRSRVGYCLNLFRPNLLLWTNSD